MSSTVTVPQTTRPVIFSGPMVRAILECRKTQTRRIANLPPAPMKLGEWEPSVLGCAGTKYSNGSLVPERIWSQPTLWHTRNGKEVCCPYGVAGDRLYVKEGLKRCGKWAFYDLDGTAVQIGNHDQKWRWKNAKLPARFMPKDYSRITLEITKVRVERLQDISREDAISEGVAWCDYQNKSGDRCERCGARLFSDDGEPLWHSPIVEYQLLWDSLHGKGAWDKNPWVWVLEFKRHLSENGTRSDSGSEFPKSVSGRAQ